MCSLNKNKNITDDRKEFFVTPDSCRAIATHSPPLLLRRSPIPFVSQIKDDKPFQISDSSIKTPCVSKYQPDNIHSNFCYHTPKNGFSLVKVNHENDGEQQSQETPAVPYIPTLDLQYSFIHHHDVSSYCLKPKKRYHTF